MIFLAKGDCLLGVNGKPPAFQFQDDGNCIAVGEISGKALEALDAVLSSGEFDIGVDVYGDFDTAGYLEKALELLKPKRSGNVPDFKAMYQLAVQSRSAFAECPLLEYCNFESCSECICAEWEDEIRAKQQEQLEPDPQECEEEA